MQAPRAFCWSCAGVTVGLIVLIAILSYAGPALYNALESRANPVVGPIEWVVRPEEAEKDNGWVKVTFEVEKRRDCLYQNMRVFWVDSDETLVRVPWKYVDDGEGFYRSVGRNRMSYRFNTHLPADRLKIEVSHQCAPWLPNITARIWGHE